MKSYLLEIYIRFKLKSVYLCRTILSAQNQDFNLTNFNSYSFFVMVILVI